MQKAKVEALFPLFNSKVTGHRLKWVQGPCPFAPWRHESGRDAHPSFGIKWDDKEKSICKCLSCGYGGDLSALQMDLSLLLRGDPELLTKYNPQRLLQLIAEEFEDQEFDPNIPDFGEGVQEVKLFEYPAKWLATFPRLTKAFPAAWNYCMSRHITPAMIELLDLRYDPRQKRVCFPFRDFNNKLMGVQGRAIDPKNELRYFFYDYGNHKNMQVWLGEHHVNLDRPLVLVEGPFDYASVRRVYHNVVASFSAGIGWDKIKRIADASEIITFYDYGKGGTAAREKVRKVLTGTPITDLIPPDAKTDPGAMALEVVAEYLQDHVNFDGLAYQSP